MILSLIISLIAAKTCKIPDDVVLDPNGQRIYDIAPNDVIEYKDTTIKITEINILKTVINSKKCVYEGTNFVNTTKYVCPGDMDSTYCSLCLSADECFDFLTQEKINELGGDVIKNCKTQENYFDYVVSSCDYVKDPQFSKCRFSFNNENGCIMKYTGYETVKNEQCGEEIELTGYILAGYDTDNRYKEINLPLPQSVKGLYVNNEKLIVNYMNFALVCDEEMKNCIINQNSPTEEVYEINKYLVQIPYSNSYSDGVTKCNVKEIKGKEKCDCESTCRIDISVTNQPCRFAGELIMCDEAAITVILPEDYCDISDGDDGNSSKIITIVAIIAIVGVILLLILLMFVAFVVIIIIVIYVVKKKSPSSKKK